MILTLIVVQITGVANDKKSKLSILKKFFEVKTSDPNYFPEKGITDKKDKDVYKFKFKPNHKAAFCCYFFSCFGCTPSGFSRSNRKY